MKTLPCLSVRQPWAWLIVNGHKPIENRSWATAFRGRLLIHASKTLDPSYLEQVQLNLCDLLGRKAPTLPAFDALRLGGLVGSVTMTDCVRHSDSPYFTGPFAFVFEQPKALQEFKPLRGQQGFFNVPASEVAPCI